MHSSRNIAIIHAVEGLSGLFSDFGLVLMKMRRCPEAGYVSPTPPDPPQRIFDSTHHTQKILY